ncbi:MAG: M12 family metallo-peptidase, partial [Planctomycetota bacterium]
FGNATDTMTYVMQLYAAVSDVFMRDVNTRVELSFVRLWDNPNDLFNQEDPISEFRNYWNQNMTGVHRDVAQFCSGRVNFPYGGVAFLDALCNSSAYSVTGYNLGYFVNPDIPHVFNRDIIINAHELGHNCGTLHTHDYGLDDCNLEVGPAQRGSIMSYCGQTRSGGDGNHDLRFHSFVQGVMESYIISVGCVADDCNGNGVDDAEDITSGTSDDLNGNGIPDECEDCNTNGQLDDIDILGGSPDLNSNGIPDECEPDCNSNGIPDDADILGGFSPDLDFNNVPDECEEDCDSSGVADYLEIMADMSLDLDRNARFDSCQDCDGDGTPDLVELDGAHDIWVATITTDHVIREFHAVTGALVRESVAQTVGAVNDLIIDEAGRIFVSSADDARIVEFDRAGNHVGDLVSAGGGGLIEPAGLTIGPSGNLFVADNAADAVREYDRDSGVYLGDFVTPGDGGLAGPFGLAFGPTGSFFVTSDNGRVLEYDGATGAFLGVLVTVFNNGGLTAPRGLLFTPDGRLLVASLGTNAVLEFAGDTGWFIRQFNDGGTATRLTMDEPWGLRIGPDGDVYVSRHGTAAHPPVESGGQHLHLTQARVYQFDVDTGRFVRAYLIGNDTGLDMPTGFDFMPGGQTDCNFNQSPDSCDLTAGASPDCNANAMPDECERLSGGDFDGDGDVGPDDFAAFSDCLAGPDQPPNPTDASCAGACLDAFDFDLDEDVDLEDFDALTEVYTG